MSTMESVQRNDLGQPIGRPVLDWRPPDLPPHRAMDGRFCQLQPLDATRHADALFAANSLDEDGQNWTYLPYGPFPTLPDYRGWIEACCGADDPQFYAVVPTSTGVAAGVASYLRMAPENGSIEVGHIHFSTTMQRRPAATEAMFLMMQRAFDLGYRRYEWKCDALNAGSCSAAQRLGLSFEGIFRQATVYKGRNRDTAWFAAIDSDWPALHQAFTRWLHPSNFGSRGEQRTSLRALTRPLLRQPLPAGNE